MSERKGTSGLANDDIGEAVDSIIHRSERLRKFFDYASAPGNVGQCRPFAHLRDR
jgi:hypothetical protein